MSHLNISFGGDLEEIGGLILTWRRLEEIGQVFPVTAHLLLAVRCSEVPYAGHPTPSVKFLD